MMKTFTEWFRDEFGSMNTFYSQDFDKISAIVNYLNDVATPCLEQDVGKITHDAGDVKVYGMPYGDYIEELERALKNCRDLTLEQGSAISAMKQSVASLKYELGEWRTYAMAQEKMYIKEREDKRRETGRANRLATILRRQEREEPVLSKKLNYFDSLLTRCYLAINRVTHGSEEGRKVRALLDELGCRHSKTFGDQ